jgi:hypothetical protein
MIRIRVAVAVGDDALERLDEVMAACRALGFRADSRLTGVGVFTGFMDENALAALRAVPGVAAVELEHRMQVHAPVRRPR